MKVNNSWPNNRSVNWRAIRWIGFRLKIKASFNSLNKTASQLFTTKIDSQKGSILVALYCHLCLNRRRNTSILFLHGSTTSSSKIWKKSLGTNNSKIWNKSRMQFTNSVRNTTNNCKDYAKKHDYLIIIYNH